MQLNNSKAVTRPGLRCTKPIQLACTVPLGVLIHSTMTVLINSLQTLKSSFLMFSVNNQNSKSHIRHWFSCLTHQSNMTASQAMMSGCLVMVSMLLSSRGCACSSPSAAAAPASQRCLAFNADAWQWGTETAALLALRSNEGI